MLYIFNDSAVRWNFGGVLLLDQIQNPDEPGTQYAGPEVQPGTSDSSNPLRLCFVGGYFVGDRYAKAGDRILCDVAQGNYALFATNIRAEAAEGR
ncbi:MAG: hypothetical protein ABSE40_17525 [Candidatus Sulfotelmatobacter sp.]